jgi:acetyltransferase-like isoleucine patch superfamily enzyme
MITIHKRFKNKYRFFRHMKGHTGINVNIYLGNNSSYEDLKIAVLENYAPYLLLKIGDNTKLGKLKIFIGENSSNNIIKIGSNCDIDDKCCMYPGVSISNHVTLGYGSTLYKNVKIHPHAVIGKYVTIIECAVIESHYKLYNYNKLYKRT